MAKKKAKELDLADVLAGELNKYSKDQKEPKLFQRPKKSFEYNI